uniref:Uncharacterized protein n=1 Tax=Anguilla anguilla TaxID=7936 RepID=A0A0E9WS60_ANGAN
MFDTLFLLNYGRKIITGNILEEISVSSKQKSSSILVKKPISFNPQRLPGWGDVFKSCSCPLRR